MIGSMAVTSPLAGRQVAITSPCLTWMYGSRFDTTMTSCPGRSEWRIARSVSGVHASCSSSRDRCSASRSRISARRSPAMGCSSGASSTSEERHRPSPRSRACSPFTQPRQLSCATTTVMSAIAPPRPTKKRNRYLRVSSLRRTTKLMSCTRASCPAATPPPIVSGRTDTRRGPYGLLSSRPAEPHDSSRSAHRISGGNVGVATAGPASAGQNPMA